MICLTRLGWIAGCLRYAGRFGSAEKKALMQAFDVSEATISRDQAKLWSFLADDGSVELDRGKLTVRDPAAFEFPENVPMPSLDDWLEIMMGNRYAQVVSPARIEPRDNIIRAMVRGIREGFVARSLLGIHIAVPAACPSPHRAATAP